MDLVLYNRRRRHRADDAQPSFVPVKILHIHVDAKTEHDEDDRDCIYVDIELDNGKTKQTLLKYLWLGRPIASLEYLRAATVDADRNQSTGVEDVVGPSSSDKE